MPTNLVASGRMVALDRDLILVISLSVIQQGTLTETVHNKFFWSLLVLNSYLGIEDHFGIIHIIKSNHLIVEKSQTSLILRRGPKMCLG